MPRRLHPIRKRELLTRAPSESLENKRASEPCAQIGILLKKIKTPICKASLSSKTPNGFNIYENESNSIAKRGRRATRESVTQARQRKAIRRPQEGERSALLLLKLFFYFLNVHRLNRRLEVLYFQIGASAGCLRLVFAVFSLQCCNCLFLKFYSAKIIDFNTHWAKNRKLNFFLRRTWLFFTRQVSKTPSSKNVCPWIRILRFETLSTLGRLLEIITGRLFY